jgi:hypothetical protein
LQKSTCNLDAQQLTHYKNSPSIEHRLERLDFEVLEVAVKTLPKVLICCIEANSDVEAKKIDSLLTSSGFELDHYLYVICYTLTKVTGLSNT